MGEAFRERMVALARDGKGPSPNRLPFLSLSPSAAALWSLTASIIFLRWPTVINEAELASFEDRSRAGGSAGTLSACKAPPTGTVENVNDIILEPLPDDLAASKRAFELLSVNFASLTDRLARLVSPWPFLSPIRPRQAGASRWRSWGT
jgi:hypothetical protein